MYRSTNVNAGQRRDFIPWLPIRCPPGNAINRGRFVATMYNPVPLPARLLPPKERFPGNKHNSEPLPARIVPSKERFPANMNNSQPLPARMVPPKERFPANMHNPESLPARMVPFKETYPTNMYYLVPVSAQMTSSKERYPANLYSLIPIPTRMPSPKERFSANMHSPVSLPARMPPPPGAPRPILVFVPPENAKIPPLISIKNDGTRPQSSTNPLPPLSSVQDPPSTSADRASRNFRRQKQVYARKVFIGGLPADITEDEIVTAFGCYGRLVIDWPRRTGLNGCRKGYVFIIYQKEQSVQKLLNGCTKANNNYYILVSSATMPNKPVQVRPWRISETVYMLRADMSLNPRRTVFIGGVPRPTRADDIAQLMNKTFGLVCHVGIDIDPELKYPKGAARVTFVEESSFVAAIIGRFIYLPHADGTKRVEIKPYIFDDQMCDECDGTRCNFRYAPYFCGHPNCLQYYCEPCWDLVHCTNYPDNIRATHRPLMRTDDQVKVLDYVPHLVARILGTM